MENCFRGAAQTFTTQGIIPMFQEHSAVLISLGNPESRTWSTAAPGCPLPSRLSSMDAQGPQQSHAGPLAQPGAPAGHGSLTARAARRPRGPAVTLGTAGPSRPPPRSPRSAACSHTELALHLHPHVPRLPIPSGPPGAPDPRSHVPA